MRDNIHVTQNNTFGGNFYKTENFSLGNGKSGSVNAVMDAGRLDNNKVFIVHGHDEMLKLKLKDYLQNTLGFSKPVILSEVAGRGRTIIESFEEESQNAGFIFVLLTPDDFVDDSQLRARQNVIFELGYFMGKYGRKSGRVIVLLKGEVDIPSDLGGILYIRVDQGIEAAGEEIRKAIKAVK